jgi:hypothetical protein
MIINLRTKISLSQLLDLFEYNLNNLLLEKHSLDHYCSNTTDIKDALEGENLELLIQEIISTKRDLRSRVSPKYRFDERWEDFQKCLLLDGYRITENNSLISIEPTVDGIVATEDDLTLELRNSSLSKREKIIILLLESANAFKNTTPDYNQCLSKARIALETIIRNKVEDENGTIETWGRSLNILKANSFLTNSEEQAISSTYTYVSDGSHIPLGFTEEEYARYGRNLLMTVCYYIIKKQNSSASPTIASSWLD